MPSPALSRPAAPLAALLLPALMLTGLATPAHARDGQFFLRGELGNDEGDFDFAPRRAVGDFEDDDRAHTARGGYYFNRHFAIEAHYTRLYAERLAESRFGEFSLDATVDAVGIGAVGKKRFGEKRGFYVQARGGLARYKGRTTSITNPCASPLPCRFVSRTDDSANAPYLGVGMGYDFNDHVGVGVNYDAYRAEFDGWTYDARALTAAVEIRF